MIEKAGRPVTHLEITKWAFLLAHETPSQGGNAFYQFLPYQWGPFSFCLYREIDALVHDGYLTDEDKAWRIIEDIDLPTGDLPRLVQENAARVVERFQNKTSKVLSDYVYQQFPRFTVNSNMKKLKARPVASIAAFTIGYEGLLVDGFLDLLIRVGIQRVFDVRKNPIARRYGFHKRTLERLCGKVQIEYVHFPQLGIPSHLRHDLKSESDYERLFARYEREILPAETETVSQVAALMNEKPTALMCMEADPVKCHRSRLANMIARETDLSVHHLGGND
jgi:uncharacterized protein (DUF488 family)